MELNKLISKAVSTIDVWDIEQKSSIITIDVEVTWRKIDTDLDDYCIKIIFNNSVDYYIKNNGIGGTKIISTENS